MKSTATISPASLAKSPVKRPIPAPNSKILFPLKHGSKEITYMNNTHLVLAKMWICLKIKINV